MTFPSIRLEGAILSADLLDSIERGDKNGQKARDFGFDPTAKVKDEISSTWATAKALWTAYQAKLSTLREGAAGTTETRNLFVIPLLTVLGYAPELAEAETLHGKSYAISHRDNTRDGLPIHIVGPFLSEPGSNPDRSSLDVRVKGVHRLSPHALVQEYLNLTEHLYGIVTNGHKFRLLRDSSRLIKLSFLEFDFERIFGEELFADFALFYRLLHASRMPANRDEAAQSIIELYHQDALDSGSRIREGLSEAVKAVILSLADGFLQHPHNHGLREFAAYDPQGKFPSHLYQHLLRLVYRILFLMVVEERGLVHDPGTSRRQREIYDQGYSLARLRRLSEKAHFVQARHHDAWLALRALFRLVDESGSGKKLGISPLGGDLFDSRALGPLTGCSLDNATLLGALRQLTLFTNPATKQRMRVNYGALNVEEFGSVYQGLLEFEPRVTEIDGKWHLSFALGDERSKTGSHYTPEELVQPLLKHSLDHLIREIHEKHSTAEDRARALLALKVCDVACGSGHILLAAARRIGVELAILRSGDDQPSPSALREAVRDAIRHCIHGMDLNPLAVELCKVALWLEAHVPGQPLSFLDHRIKCGNAIVGLAHRAELQRGIPDEAFKTLAGDDKDFAASLRKRNKDERKGFQSLNFAGRVEQDIEALDKAYRDFENTKEKNAADYYHRREEYEKFRNDQRLRNLRLLADAQVAQFYLPKTPEYDGQHVTHDLFRKWLGGLHPTGQEIAAAQVVAGRKSFAHWFIEFWDIVDAGGFDLILGNPPYLGDKKQKRMYGEAFQSATSWQFKATKAPDMVAYFLCRITDLLSPRGFAGLITTNSIAQGSTREMGLDKAISADCRINYANPSIPWPGQANVIVSLFCLHRGSNMVPCVFKVGEVNSITAGLREEIGSNHSQAPERIASNEGIAFTGTYVNGKGFFLTPAQAAALLKEDPNLGQVIRQHINGDDLYRDPAQRGSRFVIDFGEVSLEEARCHGEAFRIVDDIVRPERAKQSDKMNRENWWLHARRRPELYRTIRPLRHVIAAARVSRTCAVAFIPSNQVLDEKLVVFARDSPEAFAFLQSSFHWEWVWYRCTTMKHDITYGVQRVFETLPLPRAFHETDTSLGEVGTRYHQKREGVLLSLGIGLTTFYHLFHAQDLSQQSIQKKFGRSEEISTEAYKDILSVRDLLCEMDQSVLSNYGWNKPDETWGEAIALGHGFHSVSYLPEDDCIRFTIHPSARDEILRRLEKLNHARAAEEQNASLDKTRPASARKTARQTVIQLPPDDLDLFRPAAAKPHQTAPRELLLPTCKRVPLVPADAFLLVFVHKFLSRAGEQSTLRVLDGVFHLLRHRQEHLNEVTAVLGETGEEWIKRFNDTLPNEDFVPFLKRLETQHWIDVDRASGAITMLPKFPSVPKDEWREFDIEASLRVLTARPDVIEWVAASEDSSRSTRAFASTKTA